MGKLCSVCGAEKNLGAFQKRAASHDGVTAACRECLRKRDAARYKKERDYRMDRHREYMQTPAGKRAHKKAAARWRSENKLKRAAHLLLASALKSGIVVKAPCERCGSTRVHAHHEDYSRPLDVMWLCAKHHREVHAEKVTHG